MAKKPIAEEHSLTKVGSSAIVKPMEPAEAVDAARLKQSTLKAAFEVRLVPQDPADELASVLLARLAARGGEKRVARRDRPLGGH